MLRLFALGLATLFLQAASLQPTGSSQAVVAGLVRTESGEPLRGARIVIADATEVTDPAVTGQDGRFQIPTGAGDVTLRVKKAGYAERRVAVDAAAGGELLDIVLDRGAVLTGRVTDDLNAPLADISVTVRRADGQASPGVPPVTASTVSDDLGEYRIGSLPPGRYEVTPSDASRLFRAGPQAGIVSVIAPIPAAAGAAPDSATTFVTLTSGEESFLTLVRPRRDTSVTPASAVTMTPTRSVDASASMGRVSGRVFGPGMQPLSSVILGLVSATGWPGSQSAGADPADGGYEFEFVPPGTYQIVASSQGMADTRYGAQAGGDGEWIEVAAGDRLDGYDIVVQRGGVITGNVVDEYGEPLEGMSVHVWQVTRRDGRSELRAVASLPRLTDDRGRYRVYGLQPGTYYVAVSERSGAPGPDPATERRILGFAGGLPAPVERVSYYPGRPMIQEAVPVRVDAGVDASGINMVFAPAPGARVIGVALASNGEPFRGLVTLGVSRRSGAPVPPAQQALTDAGGRFEFPNVAPGDYVLRAGGLQSAIAVHDGSGALPENREYGSALIDVSGDEVGPVTVRTSPGSTVSGRIVQEGPGPPAANAAFRLNVSVADTDLGPETGESIRPDVDGAFDVSRLIGPMRFLPGNAPTGWWLKSVMIGGVNAADDPVMFGTAQESKEDVEVVFSSVTTGISGRVLDGGREGTSGAAVIAFSTDSTRWFEGSRHLKRSTSVAGRFTIPALPPGDYYLVAARGVDAAASQDPEVLRSLVPRARLVTVTEGQLIDADLDVIR